MGKDKRKWITTFVNVLIVIEILVISLVCLIGMILCINSFISNQTSFNTAYTEVISGIADTIYSNDSIANDNLNVIMTHLENLQVIQKNSVTNDLMSFVYGILSTTLVGLCVGFVAKCKKNADEAKRNAVEAKSTADDAKAKAETVKIDKEDISKIKGVVEEKAEEVKKLIDSASNQLVVQMGNTELAKIHIEIIHAKFSLYLSDQVDANGRIYNINSSVRSLGGSYDNEAISQLRNELLSLEDFTYAFKEKAGAIADEGEKISVNQSIDRYFKQIGESIDICDRKLGISR